MVDDLDNDALSTPNVVGRWSLKDVVTHVAYWSNVEARHAEAEAQGQSLPTDGDD